MTSRTVCDCIEDIKACFTSYNLAPIPGIVEEIRMLVRRMEAAIDNQRDYEYWRNRIKEQREELTKLKKEINLYKQVKELK